VGVADEAAEGELLGGKDVEPESLVDTVRDPTGCVKTEIVSLETDRARVEVLARVDWLTRGEGKVTTED